MKKLDDRDNVARIDAITNDPISIKHVAVSVGKCGDLLYYNTSTLIQIAKEFGQFLQPPYFREPMNSGLLGEVTLVEGKEKISQIQSEIKNSDYKCSGRRIGEIMHNWNGFIEFMNTNHEPLSNKNLYYCPVCYYKATLDVQGQVKGANKEENGTGSRDDSVPHEACKHDEVDPLDVFAYFEGENKVHHFVFSQASSWKRHVYEHHYVKKASKCKGLQKIEKSGSVFASRQLLAQDYSLRMLINGYVSNYNTFMGKKRMFHKLHGTTKQYWHCDAHFNVHRYNRLVDHILLDTSTDDRSICEGDPFSIIFSSDDTDGDLSVTEEDSLTSSQEQATDSSRSTDDDGIESEARELFEMAKQYTKRAKRGEVHRRKSDEDSSGSSVSSGYSGHSEIHHTHSLLTEHEKNQMEKMAFKQEPGGQCSPIRRHIDYGYNSDEEILDESNQTDFMASSINEMLSDEHEGCKSGVHLLDRAKTRSFLYDSE